MTLGDHYGRMSRADVSGRPIYAAPYGRSGSIATSEKLRERTLKSIIPISAATGPLGSIRVRRQHRRPINHRAVQTQTYPVARPSPAEPRPAGRAPHADSDVVADDRRGSPE